MGVCVRGTADGIWLVDYLFACEYVPEEGAKANTLGSASELE